MSAADSKAPKAGEDKPAPSKIPLGIAGAAVLLVGILGGLIPAVVIALALMGTPLFAIMGGGSEIAWLVHPDDRYHHFRFIAPNVLDEKFAGSPILVTIPLFTFVGYALARAKTAERIVRVSAAVLGWVPGGLAIVCVVASAVFTLLTGGSGVTIIAIGGLLLPALRKQGYPESFSLGLLTSGGSLGLLLPFAVPLLVYALVAGVDTGAASVAVLAPGLLILVFFAAYSMYIGIRDKVPTMPFNPKEVGAALWEIKWEAFIPVIVALGIAKLGLNIDECAGIVAFYTIIIEVFVYKDISFRKDLPKIAKSAMTMAGAVILILMMANALVNYVIDQQIPNKVLEKMVALGLDQRWQFLLVMNVFLLFLGMLMEGFSAIFVAVPLLLPFAARFHLGPFHLGMIFLLNLELAYCMPPLGLNLFIASFRFNRPATSLYKPILPFLAILAGALMLITYVPGISDIMVRGRIAKARAEAESRKEAPREAWLLECIQEDRLNPLPCTPEDQKRFPGGKTPEPEKVEVDAGAPSADAGEEDELLKMMVGGDGGAKPTGSAAPEGDDDLLAQMMGAGKDAGSADAGALADGGKKADNKVKTDDELLKEMLGQ
ncbi:MAG: TRAP transporter large permease [Polyangiaceae bacterium]